MRIKTLPLVCIIFICLSFFSNAMVFGQQETQGTQTDEPPVYFRVASKFGRESFTVSCMPIGHDPIVNKIKCKFNQVRFQLPNPDGSRFPISMEHLLKFDSEAAKELKEDPIKFKEDYSKAMKDFKKEVCLPSSEGMINSKKMINDPKIGPKRKRFYQELIEACSLDDPFFAYSKIILEIERRTCELWVDQFSLEFKKIGRGHWIFRADKPGGLSKLIKIYEITIDNIYWNLTETCVPTEGSELSYEKTIWKWNNNLDYEIPYDFIKVTATAPID